MESALAYELPGAVLGSRGQLSIINGVKLFFHGVYGFAGPVVPGPLPLCGSGTEGGDAVLTAATGAGEGGVTSIGVTVGVTTVSATTPAATATRSTIALGSGGGGGDAGIGSWGVTARVTRPRFAAFRRSWRLSHSRSASAEISTPRPRNALASTSTESPSRRSRSSSARCASSCAVFGCFGWRALATNSASVGGGSGVVAWCAGGGEGIILERYSERSGSAMGALLPGSKPRGLDVGVLSYFFLWFFLSDFDSLGLLHRLSLWILQLVDVFRFRFDEFVQSLRFCFFVVVGVVDWVEVVIRSVGCSVAASLSSFGLGENGGGSC
ncbi:MAG: hypothetical protein HZA93_12840 [Verrucomicrobia bacterium]|nr:hypothetical protein [Verrucomicrobiota bacterium]